MKFDVGRVYPEHSIMITGASYAGNPRDNTMMYISAKAAGLLQSLHNHSGCVCFVPKDIDIPEDIARNNAVIACEDPVYEYACFAKMVSEEFQKKERDKTYMLTDRGYYVGENASIGSNADIGPGAVIGHDVVIGENAVIMPGAVIKNAVIGAGFICNENTVIGNYSFTMAQDKEGNKIRIPSLGRVVIGSHVEIGACNDVAAGACGDTVIEDYVKLDGLVHIGHEAHLHKNVEITAGSIVAGFAEISENAYLGINTSIRNRIRFGSGAVMGMGAVLTKCVGCRDTVIGNPAKPLGGGYCINKYLMGSIRCAA